MSRKVTVQCTWKEHKMMHERMQKLENRIHELETALVAFRTLLLRAGPKGSAATAIIGTIEVLLERKV
jgi:hypothetical protein